MSTGTRLRPLDETLRRARSLGRALGVSRVSDITRLDRLGVPVFAAVRPGAAEGSLCVPAGKGLSALEANVGAWIGGPLEYAFAEERPSDPTVIVADPQRLQAPGAEVGDLPTFAPLVDAALAHLERLPYVAARSLDDERPYLLPAELVFHPFTPPPGTRAIFGTSTNGLGAGNDIEEATAHALAEIFERDVLSFDRLDSRSLWLAPESLPEHLSAIIERARVRFGAPSPCESSSHAQRMPRWS